MRNKIYKAHLETESRSHIIIPGKYMFDFDIGIPSSSSRR